MNVVLKWMYLYVTSVFKMWNLVLKWSILVLVVDTGIVIICRNYFYFHVVFFGVLYFEHVLSVCLLGFECVLSFCSVFRMWNVVMKWCICLLVVSVGFVIICIINIIICFCTWSYFASMWGCVCFFCFNPPLFLFLFLFWISFNVYVGWDWYVVWEL